MRSLLIVLSSLIFSACATPNTKNFHGSRGPSSVLAKPEYTKAELKEMLKAKKIDKYIDGQTAVIIDWAEELVETKSDAKSCASFLIQDDTPGNYAKLAATQLIEEIEDPHSAFFAQGKLADLSGKDYCPTFDTLRREDKLLFWVYLLQNLAYKESTCKATAENWAKNVPNPPAVGLFQLEMRKDLRSWRGPACAVPSDKIKDPENNIKCTLAILKKQLVNTRHVFGKVFKNAKGKVVPSYWHGLNKGNDVWKNITAKLKEFPLCSSPSI